MTHADRMYRLSRDPEWVNVERKQRERRNAWLDSQVRESGPIPGIRPQRRRGPTPQQRAKNLREAIASFKEKRLLERASRERLYATQREAQSYRAFLMSNRSPAVVPDSGIWEVQQGPRPDVVWPQSQESPSDPGAPPQRSEDKGDKYYLVERICPHGRMGRYAEPLRERLRAVMREQAQWAAKGNKKFKAIANHAFAVLNAMKSSNAHPRELARLRGRAWMSVENTAYSPPSPTALTLASFLPRISPAGVNSTVFGYHPTWAAFKTFLSNDTMKGRRDMNLRIVTGAWVVNLLDPTGRLVAVHYLDRLERSSVARRDVGFKSLLEVDDAELLALARAQVQQGNKASGPLVANVGGVDVRLPFGEDVLSEMLSMVDPYPSVARVLAFIVALHECVTWTGVFASCYLYITDMHTHRVVEAKLRALVKQFVQKCRDVGIAARDRVWKQQGLLETELLHSDLGAGLWSIFTTFSVAGVFSTLASGMVDPFWVEQKTASLERLFQRDRQTSGLNVFLNRALAWLKLLGEHVLEASRTGDWGSLLRGRRTVSEWTRLIEVLIGDECIRIDGGRIAPKETFDAKKQTGAIPHCIAEQLTNAQRAMWLRELAGEVEVYANRVGDDSIAKAAVRQRAERALREAVSLENQSMNGASRVQPFGVFIPGPPGVGKTTFVDLMHQAIGHVRGYDTGEDAKYCINAGANFQDGFHAGQWHVQMDDIDTSVAPPTAGVLTHVQTVMKFINPAPYNMEAAAVEQKGKLWANFLLASYTTNFLEARLQGYTAEPGAFWRRFKVRVDLEPKAEFSKTSGKGKAMLDPAKAAGHLDVWNFVLWEYDFSATDGSNAWAGGPWRQSLCTSSVFAALAWINEKFLAHVSREQNRLATLTSYRTNQACGVCGLLATAHHVACQVPQGNITQPCRRGADRARQAVIDGAAHVLVQHWDLLERRAYEKAGKYLLMAAGGAAAITAVVMILRAGYRHFQQGQSDEVISDRPPVVPSTNNWQRVTQNFARSYERIGPTTWNFSAIEKTIRQRLVRVYGPASQANGLLLSTGFVLVPRHLCSLDEGKRTGSLLFGREVTLELGTQRITFTLTEERAQGLGESDLLLLWVPEFMVVDNVDLLAKFPPVSLWESNSAVDEAWLVAPQGTLSSGARVRCARGYLSDRRAEVWQGAFQTAAGDCGAVLVVRRGNGVHIVGMHALGLEGPGPSFSTAEDIHAGMITRAITELQSRNAMVQGITLHFPSELWLPGCTFTDVPAKSSFAVAQTYNPISCVVVGCAEPKMGSGTLRSRVQPTLYHEAAMALARSEGCKKNFTAPVMKGAMVGEGEDRRWKDPYTVNLEASRNCPGDPKRWLWCVREYLKGAEELSDADCVRPLTDYEAFFGIPGTNLGGTNIKTSAGAPIFGPKERVIRVDHDTKQVWFRDDLVAALAYLEQRWDAGEVVLPLSVHTLKDETTTDEKNASFKTRVFNILPYAFNHMLKRYFGPIVSWMRKHWKFFEAAVGMNMGADTWRSVMEWMEGNGPNWEDGDRRFFDVGQSTVEGLAVMLVFAELAQLLQYMPGERNRVVLMALGCIYLARYLKGDVFITCSSMPTGFWLTIWWNCVRNSLQCRYAWHYWCPDFTLVYRAHVAFLFMGDDHTGTVSVFVCGWFHQLSLRDALRTIGYDLTAGIKERALTHFAKREEVTFLKRRFVWDGDIWVVPIEKDTLFKMLAMRGPTTLSCVDHHATVLSNVLAESWMHGEAFYQKIRLFVEEQTALHQIVSRDLVVLSYGEYRNRYKCGILSTWDPATNLAVSLAPPTQNE
jgi:hypothetical protein